MTAKPTDPTLALCALCALWPILLPEAIYTHLVTPRLPEPDGARAGRVGDFADAGKEDKPSLRLLIAGDSAAAGVGVAHQDQALSGRLVNVLADDFDLTWQLIAQSGDTTPDLLRRLRDTPAQPFEVAVLSMGANDVLSRRRRVTWIAQQTELIELLHSRFEVQHIVFSAVPPLHAFPALPQPLRWFLGLRAQTFNAALAQLLQKHPEHHLFQMQFVAGENVLASDGFHPSWGTYLYWGYEVAQRIKQWYPTNTPQTADS